MTYLLEGTETYQELLLGKLVKALRLYLVQVLHVAQRTCTVPVSRFVSLRAHQLKTRGNRVLYSTRTGGVSIGCVVVEEGTSSPKNLP